MVYPLVGTTYDRGSGRDMGLGPVFGQILDMVFLELEPPRIEIWSRWVPLGYPKVVNSDLGPQEH